MNKETIFAFAFGAALIAFFIWLELFYAGQGQSEQPVPPSQSVVVLSDESYDFGEVSMQAGKVSHQFKLKNAAQAEILINKVYTSCMCTEAELLIAGQKSGPYGMAGHGFLPKINRPVKPGEEFLVKVIFDPTAHGPAGLGFFKRTVYIEDESGVTSLKIQGTVTP